jgi:hypothetical protein
MSNLIAGIDAERKLREIRVDRFGQLLARTAGAFDANDSFNRPADTTQYAAGDRISATVSNTGTTPLRRLDFRLAGNSAVLLTEFLLEINLDTFIFVPEIVFFTTGAPPTAIPGDNESWLDSFANRNVRESRVILTQSVDMGDYARSFVRDPKHVTLDEDGGIFYAIRIAAGTPTPSSEMTLQLRVSGQAI